MLAFFEELMFLFLFSYHKSGKFLINVGLSGVRHLIGIGMSHSGLSWGNVELMKLNQVGRMEDGTVSGFISVVKSAEMVGIVWGYAAVLGIAKVKESNRYGLVMRGIIIFMDSV